MSDSYDAVVFDLDNTLVRLAVDWDAVATDVAATLRTAGVTPPDDLWGMLERAEETGVADDVEAVIADHEREGARNSERLPAADTLPEVPVGVCSLNCEAACRIALDRHGIHGPRAVVGRDTVTTYKPDPAPLLETVERLDATPGATLFVGDSERDEETAANAGTAFRYVEDWLERA